jgi:hypothetical protein
MNIDRSRMHDWGQRFVRALPWIQLAAGLVLVALAWQIGHLPFALLHSGVRTTGQIVRVESAAMRMTAAPAIRASTTVFYPVVAFEAGGRRIEFRDRLGSASGGGAHQTVPVLFMPGDPAQAMIDRSLRSWMPWAPTFVVGAFLGAVGVAGLLRRARSNARLD